MVSPVRNPTITQRFGRTPYSSFHRGTDYISSDSNAVYVPAISPSGRVIQEGYDDKSGIYLISRHEWIDRRFFDLYFGHLASWSRLQPGDDIQGGTEIGRYGTTGHTYGAHVHHEVRLDVDVSSKNPWGNGRLVDPELFWENYRLVEKIRGIYPLLYEKLLGRTPSPQDLQNFVKAGENFAVELDHIKRHLANEKNCQF